MHLGTIPSFVSRLSALENFDLDGPSEFGTRKNNSIVKVAFWSL